MSELATPERAADDARSALAPARRTLWPTLRASLVAFCVVVLFFSTFAYGLSAIQEQRSQHQLYAQLRGLFDPASVAAPSIGGVIRAGTPIALISAPAAQLHDVAIVEGTSSDELLDGPGHLVDSPLPAQPGESIVMGKSATAGAPFGDITSLRRGDVISVTTGQGHFRFVVEDQRVGGDPLPEIPPSGALLTLVTATGSSWLGDVAPSHLVYVDAVLVGHDVAAPPGRPHSISSSEIQGRSDPAAWPWVIVWFVGLVAGYLGTVFLWARWRLWRTWLVAAPVLTGLLWGLSNEVLRLVPNVY